MQPRGRPSQRAVLEMVGICGDCVVRDATNASRRGFSDGECTVGRGRVRAMRWRVVLLWLLSACVASAEDFKTNDGTVYRQVHVVEVRPDALIFTYEKGMAMADFAKLPKSIRSRYHYDPAKAAAYRERDAASRQAIAEEDSRLLVAREERKMELSRLQMEASEATATPGEGFGEMSFSYQANAADRAYASAIAQIAGKIAQTEELRRAAASEPKTFWTADFWQNPVLRFLGIVMGGLGGEGVGGSGSASEPRGWR